MNETEKYSQVCDNVRGIIITTGYKIEFAISIYLTEHFSKEKLKADFFRYFLSDMTTFENKKYILSSLRKNKKIIIKEDYKQLITDIDYVQNLRNFMAHSDIVISEQTLSNFKENQLTFKNFSHKKWERNILINIGDLFTQDTGNLIYSVNAFVKTSDKIRNVLKV
jgi:uncharacterized protein YbcV (DUF1398 family)